jgi:nicotinamidase-related amidase
MSIDRATLDPSQCTLIVIDVQEKFRHVLFERDRLIRNCKIVIEGCRLLGVPIIVTEQYPEGLGPTFDELAESLGDFKAIPKTAFSCFGDRKFIEALNASPHTANLILIGIEGHVCVLQTTLDAVSHGYTVHLVKDAITSRALPNYETGLQRALQAGAFVSSAEIILFQLLADSRAEQFRAVQKLLK